MHQCPFCKKENFLKETPDEKQQYCPQCGSYFAIKETYFGKPIPICSNCHRTVTIPFVRKGKLILCMDCSTPHNHRKFFGEGEEENPSYRSGKV